jgi:5'-nucleotidase
MRAPMKRATLFLSLVFAAACATAPQQSQPPAEPVHVVLVGTTDVHGWFAGHEEKPRNHSEITRWGGVATLSAYVDALRATHGNRLLLVDSGDMWQGTLESNLFEGEPVVLAYNAMGYAAAAVGNHEFDYGPTGTTKTIASDPADDPLGALKRNASTARFPLLSANMTDKATGRTPSWAKRWILADVAGAKIGIIGISTPDTPNVTIGLNVRTLQFGDPVEATVSAAREARAAGADAIVVIAHMGGRCRDVSNVMDTASCEPDHEVMEYLKALPQGTIDVYFAGHTHSQMRQFINGVAVTQTWPYSSHFSTVDLFVDTAANRVLSDRTNIRPHTNICPAVYSGTERCEPRDAKPELALVPRTFEGRTIQPDARVAAVVQPYLDRTASKKNERLGVTVTAEFTRTGTRESALGTLLTDAFREEFKTDFAIMNSGGIRANLRSGDLIYGDIFEVSPFDNYPTVVLMTGQQIIDMLRAASTGERGLFQVSGLRYTIDAARDADKPIGQRNRLVSVNLLDGSPIDPAKTYSVVMPDFLAYGGDGMQDILSKTPRESVRIYQERPMRDVLVDVLKRRGAPISPKTDGRITILNAPPSASRE